LPFTAGATFAGGAVFAGGGATFAAGFASGFFSTAFALGFSCFGSFASFAEDFEVAPFDADAGLVELWV
jgi:hypothetical protein